MKIKELAMLIHGVVEGDGDADVTGLSGIETSNAGDLIFATDDEKLGFAEKSGASCVLTSKSTRAAMKPLVRVDNPKLAFLLLYNFMNKPAGREAFTDPSATISVSAKVGNNVWIDAGVRIGGNVSIGDNTIIEANAVIKKNCSIGSFCHIHPNVTLYDNVVLKDRVVLHSGVVLGADGFGYVREKDKIYKFPQLGRVIIENDVEIGANSTIDRGSLGDTVMVAAVVGGGRVIVAVGAPTCAESGVLHVRPVVAVGAAQDELRRRPVGSLRSRCRRVGVVAIGA